MLSNMVSDWNVRAGCAADWLIMPLLIDQDALQCRQEANRQKGN